MPRYTNLLVWVGAVLLRCATACAQQSFSLVVPSVTMEAKGYSTRPIAAAEAAAHVMAQRAEGIVKLSFRRADYPVDSLRTATVEAAAIWLAQLRKQPIGGIQLDPSGRVSAAANHEGLAKTQIAARLAVPGLSLGDKAYALRTAVEAFADQYIPERLPIAESYLQQLDALGDSAATWQFEAHKTLLWIYYLLGRSTEVVRHGTRALELLGAIPFANRNVFYGQTDEQAYSPTIEALAGQPNARLRIKQLNQLIRRYAIPSAQLVAVDSVYYYLGRMTQGSAERMIAGNAKLGTAAAPLVARYWLNNPSGIVVKPDSAIMSVNDGRIRLIEVAHTGCLPCVYELHALQRIFRQFPQVEPVLLTWTFGSWGNRLVEPAEEVRHLTDYFVIDTKITFPVGIWAGKKVPNQDGGMIPEEWPNLKDYPIFGKPMLWIVDGHGIIRRVFTGYDREVETQIVHTIKFLTRETT